MALTDQLPMLIQSIRLARAGDFSEGANHPASLMNHFKQDNIRRASSNRQFLSLGGMSVDTRRAPGKIREAIVVHAETCMRAFPCAHDIARQMAPSTRMTSPNAQKSRDLWLMRHIGGDLTNAPRARNRKPASVARPVAWPAIPRLERRQ
ncbi:MAG: hypothetical protein AB7F41_10000 [Methylocystis sp.]|uniref:hypothetical protein n=1 Tax=Methylocystis sp. TaxID=1911079 RepID=UPI003D11E4AA